MKWISFIVGAIWVSVEQGHFIKSTLWWPWEIKSCAPRPKRSLGSRLNPQINSSLTYVSSFVEASEVSCAPRAWLWLWTSPNSHLINFDMSLHVLWLECVERNETVLSFPQKSCFKIRWLPPNYTASGFPFSCLFWSLEESTNKSIIVFPAISQPKPSLEKLFVWREEMRCAFLSRQPLRKSIKPPNFYFRLEQNYETRLCLGFLKDLHEQPQALQDHVIQTKSSWER